MSDVKIRAKTVVKLQTPTSNLNHEFMKGQDILTVIIHLILYSGLDLKDAKKKINEKIDFCLFQE